MAEASLLMPDSIYADIDHYESDVMNMMQIIQRLIQEKADAATVQGQIGRMLERNIRGMKKESGEKIKHLRDEG